LWARFSATVQNGPGAHSAPIQWVPGLSWGVKRPGRGVEDPPPSRDEVKKRVELYLYSTSGPSWPVIGWPLTLHYLFNVAMGWTVRGSNPGCGRDFPHPSRPALGPTQPLYNGYRVFTGGGVKRPGRGVEDPPSSRAEVKKRIELYLYSPSGPTWPVLGWPLPLHYLFTVAMGWTVWGSKLGGGEIICTGRDRPCDPSDLLYKS